MNIYITTGTFDYLKRIVEKYPDEAIVTMVNGDDALLLHETNGKTVFKEPRKYEVFDSSGEFTKTGFVVMNHIPVTDEGRPLFEHQFKNRPRMVDNEPGFIANRVLRPLSSNTYIILTVWDKEMSFENWKNSASFPLSHEKPTAEKGVSEQPQIFASKSYVRKYTIRE
jgi:heme oxygenase (mycobilin-producing)